MDAVAAWLDSAFGDPMADAVAGTVLIVSASAASGRSPYQRCDLDLVVEAPGVPIGTVRTQVVVSRKHWPRPGMTLPARVSTSHPERFDVDWEALAR